MCAAAAAAIACLEMCALCIGVSECTAMDELDSQRTWLLNVGQPKAYRSAYAAKKMWLCYWHRYHCFYSKVRTNTKFPQNTASNRSSVAVPCGYVGGGGGDGNVNDPTSAKYVLHRAICMQMVIRERISEADERNYSNPKC